MKKITCREMGGPCDDVFEGETAMEIGKQIEAHVGASDGEHMAVVREMMKTLGGVKAWEDKVLTPAWDAAKEE